MFASPSTSFRLPTRRTLQRCVWALTAAVVAASPAFAQWKWRDAQGRLQYSDRPPPADVKDKDILQRPPGATPGAAPVLVNAGNNRTAAPPAPAPASAASAVTTDPAIEARKRQAQAEQDKAKKDAENQSQRQRAENCSRAKDYARTLESGMRIGRLNEKGEREIMDDPQRNREMAKTREVIANECR